MGRVFLLACFCFALTTCPVVSPAVRRQTEPQQIADLLSSRRPSGADDPGQDWLLDPGYLNLPAILTEVKAMGLLYEERPLVSPTILELDTRGVSYHYCPQKVYMTMDISRTPTEIVQRKCDYSTNIDRSCLSLDGNGSYSLTCQDQFSYRKVKVIGSWMYQRVFHGCGCLDTTQIAMR